MDRYTTPPPYGNLYDADTPPSTQPHTPPFDINEFINIPDSQKTTQSWDSRDGPRSTASPSLRPTPSSPAPLPDSQADSQLSNGSNDSIRSISTNCTRDKRLQIQTALLFKIPWAQIKETLDVTENQIRWAKHHRLTPQKSKSGRYAKLHTPEKTQLKEWLLSSPSHRHVAYHKIPHFLPQLHAKEQAIRTAIDEIRYCRRISRKKGFSDDPKVCQERLDLAEDGKTWPRPDVQRICFTDEVWAFGGAHTSSYITCLKDGSDRLLPECVRHKYSKLPSWMFWGSIVDGKKGPALFWEKEWGSINSARYDRKILSMIEQFFRDHPLSRYRFWQDNASSHRSYETKTNLLIRHIPTIPAPRYSPDLNLIEHVWNWIKN